MQEFDILNLEMGSAYRIESKEFGCPDQRTICHSCQACFNEPLLEKVQNEIVEPNWVVLFV